MARAHLQIPSAKPLSFKGLRGACRFYGGIKSIALTAGVSNSSLSRWLRGQPTLSEEKIYSVLKALDIPKGSPPSDKVLEWRYTIHWDDLKDALRLYFPEGGEVARAGWSYPGFSNMGKHLSLASIRKTKPREIYLLKDEHIRALVRLPPGILMAPEDMGKNFKWRNGRIAKSAFDMGKDKKLWLNGPVSLETFDKGWNSKYVSWYDVFRYANKNNITSSETLAWMRGQ